MNYKAKIQEIIRRWLPGQSYGYNEAVDEICQISPQSVDREDDAKTFAKYWCNREFGPKGWEAQIEALVHPDNKFFDDDDTYVLAHYETWKSARSLQPQTISADTARDVVTLMQEAQVWESKDVRNNKLDRAIDLVKSLPTSKVVVPAESALIKAFADGEANGRGAMKWVSGVRAIRTLLITQLGEGD
jgi:hypothetical protein